MSGIINEARKRWENSPYIIDEDFFHNNHKQDTIIVPNEPTADEINKAMNEAIEEVEEHCIIDNEPTDEDYNRAYDEALYLEEHCYESQEFRATLTQEEQRLFDLEEKDRKVKRLIAEIKANPIKHLMTMKEMEDKINSYK